ncbi:MAG: hypothetical protein R3B09_03145 [Nannocystaceae bacterium]
MTQRAKISNTTPLPCALLGLLAALTAPAVSHAAPSARGEVPPIAAEDDECPAPKSMISLQIDVATGDVYLLSQTGGTPTLVGDEIDVYVGSLSSLLVLLHYTSNDWEIDVTPSGGTSQTYQTNGGWFSYSMSNTLDEYEFAPTLLESMTAVPSAPTILIRTRKTCPTGP